MVARHLGVLCRTLRAGTGDREAAKRGCHATLSLLRGIMQTAVCAVCATPHAASKPAEWEALRSTQLRVARSGVCSHVFALLGLGMDETRANLFEPAWDLLSCLTVAGNAGVQAAVVAMLAQPAMRDARGFERVRRELGRSATMLQQLRDHKDALRRRAARLQDDLAGAGHASVSSLASRADSGVVDDYGGVTPLTPASASAELNRLWEALDDMTLIDAHKDRLVRLCRGLQV